MTKKQRFMAAVRGEVLDMVPASPLIYDRYSHAVLGRTGWQAHFDVHQMIGSIHHRGNGHVGVNIHMPDGYGWESREVDRRPDGRVTTETIWRSPYGELKSREVVGAIPHDPMAGKTVEYFVKDESDWRIYRRVLEDQLAGAADPTWDDYLRVAAVFGDDAVAGVGLPSPFQNLVNSIRGMADLLTDLYDCPDLIESILDLERELARKGIEAFVASPAELAFQDICSGTGANIGPELFAKWVLPDVRLATTLIRQAPGKCIGLYTLGPIRDLMPMFADAGVHFVESFEPNQGNITLAEAKRLYGDRICLVGNFNCLVLAFGSLEEARKEAMRCLHEGMDGGRYVLATADEVPANTKMDNLKAMVETVEKHGRYR